MARRSVLKCARGKEELFRGHVGSVSSSRGNIFQILWQVSYDLSSSTWFPVRTVISQLGTQSRPLAQQFNFLNASANNRWPLKWTPKFYASIDFARDIISHLPVYIYRLYRIVLYHIFIHALCTLYILKHFSLKQWSFGIPSVYSAFATEAVLSLNMFDSVLFVIFYSVLRWKRNRDEVMQRSSLAMDGRYVRRKPGKVCGRIRYVAPSSGLPWAFIALLYRVLRRNLDTRWFSLTINVITDEYHGGGLPRP